MCQSNVKGKYYLLDGNTEGILFGAEKKKKKKTNRHNGVHKSCHYTVYSTVETYCTVLYLKFNFPTFVLSWHSLWNVSVVVGMHYY